MSSFTRLQGRFGQRLLLLATAAVLLTGLLRRDSYTARARRVLARRDDVAVVMVDQDHFKAVQELALPIPARGQLGPWKPTEDLVAQGRQQLPDFRP